MFKWLVNHFQAKENVTPPHLFQLYKRRAPVLSPVETHDAFGNELETGEGTKEAAETR
jgi:hypothetical protein